MMGIAVVVCSAVKTLQDVGSGNAEHVFLAEGTTRLHKDTSKRQVLQHECCTAYAL